MTITLPISIRVEFAGQHAPIAEADIEVTPGTDVNAAIADGLQQIAAGLRNNPGEGHSQTPGG